jgi:hypothetical protein
MSVETRIWSAARGAAFEHVSTALRRCLSNIRRALFQSGAAAPHSK